MELDTVLALTAIIAALNYPYYRALWTLQKKCPVLCNNSNKGGENNG